MKSPQTFFKAASLTPQTFNSFYIDSKHIAEYTSGRLPIRPASVDPGLPTKGTGQYEWRGFLKAMAHMHGQDNKRGTMTNWNNGAARGFGAADDQWMRNGSVGRINLLNFNLKRLKKKGRWSPASVTSAMNAAATQDVRAIVMVPLLDRLLRGTTAPSPQAQQMLDLLNQWRQHGGNRLDLNGDGKIDYPGAAIMDAAYTNIVNNEMGARLGPVAAPELNNLAGRWDAPPGGQYDGWYQYFDRDIRGVARARRAKQGRPDQFSLTYCGKGTSGPLPLGGLDRDPGSGRPAHRPAGHRRSGGLARQRDRRSVHLRTAPAGDLAVLEPPDGHPAGHLVQVVGTRGYSVSAALLAEQGDGGSRGPPRRRSTLRGGRACRDGRIGVRSHPLELDIAVELLEALLAAQLRPGRAEEPAHSRSGRVGAFITSSSASSSMNQPSGGERGAELSPRVVQGLVERAACTAEPAQRARQSAPRSAPARPGPSAGAG